MLNMVYNTHQEEQGGEGQKNPSLSFLNKE